MPIRALIVDQASAVRSLFARVLRAVGCETHEAADGGEAIEVLESTAIDLAVIEAESALLSGVDLLQVIRDSEAYANLPVVIVTGGTDQTTLAEIVRLGAADCLTKPFDVELVRMRLQRIIKSISAAGAVLSVPSTTAGAAGSALIVDGDASVRQFVAGCLASTYATTQMETGLDALRACQVRKFSVLVTGPDTGLLSPRLLARRLRRQATLEDMRIVLLTPSPQSVSDPGAFDVILPRTIAPEAFTRRIQQLLAPQTASSHDAVVETVRGALVAATQDTIGMMAGADVSLIENDLPAGSGLEASIALASAADAEAIALDLVCDGDEAGRTALRLAGRPDADASPELALAALGEVVNMIASRVQSELASQGLSLVAGTPQLRTRDLARETDDRRIALGFASADGAVRFQMGFVVRATGEANETGDAPPLDMATVA